MKRVLFLLLLVVLSGCVATTDTDDTGDSAQTDCPQSSCASGDEGIVTTINYPSEKGTTTVYTTYRLAVRVKLSDEGESSADGIACITGLDENLFEGAGDCDCESFFIDLEEDDALGYEDVEFPSYFVDGEASGDHQFTTYTRYSYVTHGLFDVCLSGDPDNEEECDTSTTVDRLDTSSSGPVNVESITQEITLQGSNTITLRLKVTADASGASNANLVREEDATTDACLLDRDEDNTAIPVDVSLYMFGDEQTGACEDLSFEEGEAEASTTCKLQIHTDTLVGKKEWNGYVSLYYGWEERNSVSFSVVAE